jgi:osmotically-inducible protein OsmY
VANDLTVKQPDLRAPTDTEITRAVRDALDWDALVSSRHIQTTVVDGWVTPTGAVHRWHQREEAERVVGRLTGVRGITNEISVDAPPADPDQVQAAIGQALTRHAAREALHLKVAVNAQAVWLSSSQATWTYLRRNRAVAAPQHR